MDEIEDDFNYDDTDEDTNEDTDDIDYEQMLTEKEFRIKLWNIIDKNDDSRVINITDINNIIFDYCFHEDINNNFNTWRDFNYEMHKKSVEDVFDVVFDIIHDHQEPKSFDYIIGCNIGDVTRIICDFVFEEEKYLKYFKVG